MSYTNVVFRAVTMNDSQNIESDSIIHDRDNGTVSLYDTEKNSFVEVDESTICLFSTMEDKTGKNIFENDFIIHREDNYIDFGIIRFEKGQFVVKWFMTVSQNEKKKNKFRIWEAETPLWSIHDKIEVVAKQEETFDMNKILFYKKKMTS